MGDVYQDRGQDEKRTKGRVAMTMLVLDLLELHGRGLALARHGGLFGYHDRSSIDIRLFTFLDRDHRLVVMRGTHALLLGRVYA
jgi:hypothetical protein